MSKAPTLDRKNMEDMLGLTPLQEGMLFHYLKDPEGSQYNEQLSLVISQPVDRELCQQAWEVVTASNELLRTVFRWENVSKPIQLVLKHHPLDLRVESEGQRLQDVKARDLQERFDLQNVPFRVTLVKLPADQTAILVSFHHILFDGWSTGIVLKEFLDAYSALASGRSVAPLTKTKFKLFVKWVQEQDLSKQEEFWRAYLGDLSAPVSLPFREERRDAQAEITVHQAKLSKQTTHRLQAFAKEHQVTLASVLNTAWGLTLQTYSGQNDVLFGTTVSGRNARVPGIDQMVGLFINTLPLRLQTRGDEQAIELIRAVERMMQAREEYECTSLSNIKKYAGVTSDQDLFETLVVVENYPLDRALLRADSALTIESYEMFEETHFDLTLSINLLEQIEFAFAYNRLLYPPEMMEQMAEKLLLLIEQFVETPHAKVSEMEWVRKSERDLLLKGVAELQTDTPYDQTIVELFDRQANATPDALAVACEGQQLTYRELREKANRLARTLRERGVRPDTFVALLLEHSVEVVVACLAVLKAGGAYLPIDPEYPHERIQYLLEDSRAAVLLTKGRLAPVLNFTGIHLDLEDGDLYADDASDLATEHQPTDLAYCIYTSGTTGKPKAVMIEHRNLLHYVWWAAKQYVRGEAVNFPLYTSLAFDLTVTSIYTPLITGNAILVITGSSQELPIEKVIQDKRVGVIKLTPSHLRLLRNLDIDNPSVKRLILGGENLDVQLAREIMDKWGGQIEILNEYGPTEATVGCMIHSFDPRQDTGSSVPIGVAADNMQIFLLDEHKRLMPPGAVGEMYLAGDGVARGYWNRLELTAERFLEHPLAPGKRLYKTGDLARILPTGTLEYLGRADEQVKLRGHRIELGEIASVLMRVPHVSEAVVVLNQDAVRGEELVAYYVSAEALSRSELRDSLAAQLPAYMIPSFFLPVPNLPLTINGKLDKGKLPKPAVDQQNREIVPPVNDLEKSIADIWKSVLGLEQIGIHDKFFEVGGNSLNIIQVNNKIKAVTGEPLSLVDMFHYPTIYSLVRFLTDKNQPVAELEPKSEEKRAVADADLPNKTDIAIVGLAGRFPSAKNVDEFWNHLRNGVESISFFTEEELAEYGADRELMKHPNYVKAKGVLDDLEQFDPAFFGYTPAQAEVMDPQLRLLHECAWEALEDAGYATDSYKGRIGLFTGATSNFHWVERLINRMNGDLSEQFELGALNDTYTYSTRISYRLNLKGPSVTLSTACSTSLVAVHLACQSIVNGESDMALAGGVSIVLPKKSGYLYQEGMVKSPDGHCRAFDEKAKGTIGGDGVGLVVLKALDQAVADGDMIYAVIKGSSINNDGDRKVGYTAPSINGQADVIKAALAAAHVEPESISYVETHGTGTPLGDPIEVQALTHAFQSDKRGFCRIGSVKTNIGHLDAAAGAAGLIKTVLALKYKEIPPSLHFEIPNPNIDFENSPFVVNTELVPWEQADTPRRAGVSSFGIGGTNAHVVLEESPLAPETKGGRSWELITLSAKTPSALDQMTTNLGNYLRMKPDVDLADVAFTLQVARRDFPYKRTVVAAQVADAIEALTPASNPRLISTSHSLDGIKRRVVYMFSGQGGQYVNMSQQLYREEPYFRLQMDRGFEAFRSIMSLDLKQVMYPALEQEEDAKEALKQTAFAQPAIFLLEYALAALLKQWGVKQDAMIGYSFGEYVAACLAGVFSLEDAIKLIAKRGELMQKVPPGTMLSVPLTEAELVPLLPAGVSLAVVNGPSCIVSGAQSDIAAFEREMRTRRHMCMPVNGTLAAHSSLMEQVADDFLRVAKEVVYHQPTLPYISNLTGTWITAAEATDPHYWVRHMKETVRFADGLELLAAEHNTVFIEIGPGHDLSVLVRRSLDANNGQYSLNLVRGHQNQFSDTYFLLKQVGQLWLYGVSIDWEFFREGETRRKLSLPAYAFDHARYWVEEPVREPRSSRTNPSTAQLKKNNLEKWFYLPSWKTSLLPVSSDLPTGQQWLVFANDESFSVELINRLQESGQQLTLVYNGEDFGKRDDGAYRLDAREPQHFQLLLQELQDTGHMPEQIVHLWGVGDRPTQTSPAQWAREVQDNGYYSLLFLAQGLKKAGWKHDMSLWVLTSNMQAVGGEEGLHPEKATSFSSCLVIPQEYLNMRARSIDVSLPEAGSWQEQKLVGLTLEEFRYACTDLAVAYRHLQRYVRSFEPTALDAPPEASSYRENGVYLITGGLGTIGMAFAEHLAKGARAKIVLTGRSGFPDRDHWEKYLAENGEPSSTSRKIRFMQALEAQGAEVRVYQTDVNDRVQMRSVIEWVEQEYGPLNGVIHAAGVTGDLSFRVIEQTDRTLSEQHFAAKMYGLQVLEDVLEDRALDFCLLTSSLSPILGGLGFFAYAAANLYLDAFVQRHNRQHPVQWFCLNLDAWAIDADKQMSTAVGATLTELFIEPQEGIELFRRMLLLPNATQVIVSTTDLQARYDKYVKGSLAVVPMQETIKTSRYSRPNLSSALVAPGNETEVQLAEIWQNFFGLEEVGIRDDFFELGGDSLKAITVISKIHKELNVDVALPDFFNRPTIEQLAAYVQQAEKTDYLEIEPAPQQDAYHLSSAQKRLYLMQQMDREHIGYNDITVGYMEGQLDHERFDRTFQKMIARHEGLRTAFQVFEGNPMQVIYDAVDFEVEYFDVSSQPTLEAAHDKAKQIVRDFVRPFQLDQAPLMRAGLIKVEDNGHLMILDMHHIISDGLSQDIFVYDFMALYDGRDLPELKLQYKDFSVWQEKFTQSEAVQKQAAFWLDNMKQLPQLNLPTDFPRPSVKSFEGGRLEFEITPEQTQALKKLLVEEDTTLFMGLLAIYNILLFKVSGQEDIIVGAPIAGRRHVDLELILGIFVNMLALRNRPADAKSFREFLREVKENTLQAFTNQDYQFEELVHRLGLERDISRNAIFDVAFALQNSDTPVLEIEGLKMSAYEFDYQMARFDLLLMGFEVGDKLTFVLEYSSKLFKRETVERFVGYLQEIVAAVLQNADQRMKDIEIKHQLVDPKGLPLDDLDDFGF